MTDTTTRLRALFAEHLSVPEDRITEEAHLYRDLGADSLDTVELLMSVDEAFGVELDDDAWEAVQTFGDAVRVVSEALTAKVAA